MTLSNRHTKMLVAALVSLLLGLGNYLMFQPHILLFNSISFLSHTPIFIKNTTLRHFLTGYFSDITWCCALYLVTAVFSELKKLQRPGKILILVLPFIVEMSQLIPIIQGSFDWYDLLIYGLILFIFLKKFPSLNS